MAKAPNKGTKAPGRVQGLKADIDDLVIRGERGIALELGPGIEPIPTLTRTIEGASSIGVEVFDPDLEVLRKTLLSEKWEAEVDGLKFRYTGLAKSEKNLTLTLEDAWVALLKEKKGPKSVKRASSTRAEFIKRLVEEAAPGLDFFCPQLHRKQPIGTKKESKEAKQEAQENRGKGLGDVKHLKVNGETATASQKEIGDRALRTAESTPGITRVVMEALMCALIDESGLGALTGGKNVLEAEGSGEGAAIGDVEAEVHNFLTGSGGYGEGGAIGIARAHPSYSPPEIATTAQRNLAFLQGGVKAGAEPYARFTTEAKEWVEAYGGGGGSGSLSVPEPHRFEVKKKETYWAAIKRLAKEVNWRAFIVGDRFYFMPEPELFRSEVRLAIDLDAPGIENIDFEYNLHGDVTEVTVTARVDLWKPPPGSVVTLEGYGPASLGFGDAPGGADEAVSDNENATTHEGRGRYLIASIEVPMSDDPAQRVATIVLKAPTKPLPEPRAERESISVGATGAAGNKTVERMLAAAERLAEKKQGYQWGGGHGSFDDPRGYDCSGGVSFALHVGGFLDTPLDTQGLASWGEAGPGKFITVYIKTTGSAEEEHTAIEIAGVLYESGGGGENSNPNGGWGKVDASEATEFLKQFDTKRHPKGF